MDIRMEGIRPPDEKAQRQQEKPFFMTYTCSTDMETDRPARKNMASERQESDGNKWKQ